MNRLKSIMLGGLHLVAFATSASAADPMIIAANLGSQLGKATYCGFDTQEFAKRSGRALEAYTTYGTAERGKALRQFMDAAILAAQSGPVGESCSEFNVGYQESLQILRDAGF
jgi:hypothetical protein